MAASLDKFAAALHGMIDSRPPTAGSPAKKEADGEPYAGEWGDAPSGEMFTYVCLLAASCCDHLAGAAAVIRAPLCSVSSYTLMRSVTESAALACYFASPEIDSLERVRRGMNWRLDGLCEQINLIRPFSIPRAGEDLQDLEAKIAAISRAGSHHGLVFHRQDRWRQSAYFGDKPQPGAMNLVDAALKIVEDPSDTPRPSAGHLSYRFLSAVAHGKSHGLGQFISEDITSSDPGQRTSSFAGVNAFGLALHLFAGPLCAASLIRRLCWFAGWDIDEVQPAMGQMLFTWGRITGIGKPRPRR